MILANQINQSWDKVLPAIPAPIYFIYGGEPQQTLEAQIAINSNLRQHGFDVRHNFNVDNTKFNWDNITAIKRNLNLFSSKQIIEIDLKPGSLGQPGSAALLDFLATPAADICLVLITGKLETAATKSKWFLEISRAACVVVTKPIYAQNFQQYAIARFNAAGFTLSDDAAIYISGGYTANSIGLAQLITRLQLCFPTACTLKLADIAQYVDQDANFSVFELVDTAINGDIPGTYTALQCLKSNRIDPIIVIWAFIREVRSLLKIRYMTQTGMPLADACKVSGVWATKLPSIRAFLAVTPVIYLENLLQQSLSVDAIAKNIAVGLIWDSLLTLYLKLAGLKFNLNLEETT